ncbi:hypothetical protein Godav_008563 [Gossypium davidsonii]|uniref:Avr9/Cf-9 rapidly elicited protein 146 n=1 Tax=Gossypium davidsonii TaxID=34287 RepID=A0A7J8SAH3_GOSDV|nr:hypothetical protein [Gossypium davidsonii]
MEQNVPVMTKRVWSIVKAVLFMMRKGLLSKRKLMVDLNVMLKRGKIAGAKAIGNLMFHHHSNRQVSSSSTAEATATAVQDYYHHFFACTHAPPTLDDDNVATMNALKVALEMINKNDGNNSVVAASPMLPGFGQTPLARQLRITDSPFPLRDMDEDADYVDKAAEDFINRFYKDLKQQTK